MMTDQPPRRINDDTKEEDRGGGGGGDGSLALRREHCGSNDVIVASPLRIPTGSKSGSTVGMNLGRWTEEEHRMFVKGLEEHGREWTAIASSFVKSRKPHQVRWHAKKYFEELAKRELPVAEAQWWTSPLAGQWDPVSASVRVEAASELSGAIGGVAEASSAAAAPEEWRRGHAEEEMERRLRRMLMDEIEAKLASVRKGAAASDAAAWASEEILGEAKSKIDEHARRSGEAEADTERGQAEVENLRKQLDGVSAEAARARAEMAERHREELDRVRAEAASVAARVAEASAAAALEEWRRGHAEKEAVQCDLESERLAREGLETTLAETRGLLDEANRKLDEASSLDESRCAVIEELNASLSVAERRLVDVESARDATGRELRGARSEIETLRKSLEERGAVVETLVRDAAELGRSLREARSSVEDGDGTIAKLREALRRSEVKCNLMRDRLDELGGELPDVVASTDGRVSELVARKTKWSDDGAAATKTIPTRADRTPRRGGGSLDEDDEPARRATSLVDPEADRYDEPTDEGECNDEEEGSEGDEEDASPGRGSPDEVMSEGTSKEDFLRRRNDLCQVCELGGEVLRCSTCKHVFHTECVRPVVKKIPRDNWSCAYCVGGGLRGYKDHSSVKRKARAAVRTMNSAQSREERLEAARKRFKVGSGKEDDDKEVEGCGNTKKSMRSSTGTSPRARHRDTQVRGQQHGA